MKWRDPTKQRKFVPISARQKSALDRPRLAASLGGHNAKRKAIVSLPKLKCLEEPK
jgi:hypothetical protein